MNMKFLLLLFISCFLLAEFANSSFLHAGCYPDTEQTCDAASEKLEWPKTKLRYLLFTRKNPKVPELLHMCNGTLPKNTRFNPDNQLVVIIPGFLFGTCEINTIPEIKDELLEIEDMNIILIVNAEEYGNDFLTAMENSEKIARTTIKVLRNIQDKTGIKNEKVYLIGHSLGAHVSGFVGKQFPVRRITGLDPAGVMYTRDLPINKRLDPSDAEIVDVIHTNGGTGLPYLGAYYPMGDADFYANDGANQPSCTGSAWNAVKKLNLLFVVGVSSVPSLCSHFQALEYYKQSINSPEKFTAYSCKSYKKFKTGNCTEDDASTVTMGYHFEENFKPDHKREKFPRKYYIEIQKA